MNSCESMKTQDMSKTNDAQKKYRLVGCELIIAYEYYYFVSSDRCINTIDIQS